MENDTPTISPTTLSVDDVKELQRDLGFVDMLSERLSQRSSSGFTELLVAQLGHIVVRINDESGRHQRPHLHVKYKHDHSASYAIDSFEVLAGDFPRQYERVVTDWGQKHREKLLAIWNELKAGKKPSFEVECQP